MKKDKDKSKKSHESTIGKIIYGFLLFLPLLAISVTCGYAVFNKNAYQSYDGNNFINSKQQIQTSEQFIPNNTYYINLQELRNFEYSWDYLTINLNNYKDTNLDIKTIWNLSEEQANTITSIFIQTNISNGGLIRVNAGSTQYQNLNLRTNESIKNINNFSVISPSMQLSTNIYTKPVLYMLIYGQEKIDNVFYYSIEKVQQSPLFNWAENSIIYTGMNEFTTSLSITTPFIPLLLTYWLIISIVYFLYDIVLVILTVLHRKIHNLQDSI